uniref:Uncharacterized protein n=1 Tax=Rhipicephalus pulchellus TaxID=72859 RepID=L7LZM6_RHIPC
MNCLLNKRFLEAVYDVFPECIMFFVFFLLFLLLFFQVLCCSAFRLFALMFLSLMYFAFAGGLKKIEHIDLCRCVCTVLFSGYENIQ